MKWDQSGAWVPRWPVGHQVRTSRFTIDILDHDRTAFVYVVSVSGPRFLTPDRTTMSELFIEDLIHDHYGVGPVQDHQPPPTRVVRSLRARRVPRRVGLAFEATWRTCLFGAVCAAMSAAAFGWGVTTYRVGPGLLACLGGFAGLSVGLALATEWGQRKARSHRQNKEGME